MLGVGEDWEGVLGRYQGGIIFWCNWIILKNGALQVLVNWKHSNQTEH